MLWLKTFGAASRTRDTASRSLRSVPSHALSDGGRPSASRWTSSPGLPQPFDTGIPGLLWPAPRPLSAFALEATDGEAFDLSRLEGRWTFLFFGFTFCPDVCPTTLMTMAAAGYYIQVFGGESPGSDETGETGP